MCKQVKVGIKKKKKTNSKLVRINISFSIIYTSINLASYCLTFVLFFYIINYLLYYTKEPNNYYAIANPN